MFLDLSKKIFPSDIGDIENKLGFKLPKKLVQHYFNFNGGTTDKPLFYSEISDVEIYISAFYPIKYFNTNDEQTLEDTYLSYRNNEIFPSNFLPFAFDWGGNQICINLDNDNIVVIWMDTGEFTNDCIEVLSNDFTEFIEKLYA